MKNIFYFSFIIKNYALTKDSKDTSNSEHEISKTEGKFLTHIGNSF